MNVVITGANRGIGLALARLYAARGDRVIGTARDPGQAKELASLPAVRVLPLEVRDDESVAALARAIDEPVDVLVNNAGVGAWESLDRFDGRQALEVFDTNAVGPVRITKALLPQLRKAKGKVFHVSSGLGSITDNSSGGYYAYRMSKAALGMAGKTLAIDLRRDGITSIVVEPGWVQTDMGGRGAAITAEESARQLLAIFDERGIESTGKFFTRHGRELAW